MKLKSILVIICVVICLFGCKRNMELRNIHNEINGMFTSVNDNVYYIDNKDLYRYSYDQAVKVCENVVSVQKYNNTVYFIYTDNYRDYSLYKNSEDKVEKIFDINSGTYQQSIVYNNKLYSCINNKITVYDLQTKEHKIIETEKPVSRFCIEDNRLYYWSIKLIDTSLDDYIDSIRSGDELKIFDGVLYSFNIDSYESKELVHTLSSKDTFFLSPIKNGVVFFDSGERELNMYDDIEIKTLFNGDVLNMMTDDENVYYSVDDNIIYQLNVNTNDINVFINNLNRIYGFDNQYVYDGNGNIFYGFNN